MKELEELVIKMNDLIELRKRAKQFSGDMMLVTFHKNSEDGLLNNIQNANTKQLSTIINAFRWKYYTEYNDKEVLVPEINRRIRLSKLEKLKI